MGGLSWTVFIVPKSVSMEMARLWGIPCDLTFRGILLWHTVPGPKVLAQRSCRRQLI